MTEYGIERKVFILRQKKTGKITLEISSESLFSSMNLVSTWYLEIRIVEMPYPTLTKQSRLTSEILQGMDERIGESKMYTPVIR